MVGLRLFPAKSGASDAARMDHAKVPQDARAYRTSLRSPWPRLAAYAAPVSATAAFSLALAAAPPGPRHPWTDLGSGAEGLTGQCCHGLPGCKPRATTQEPYVRCRIPPCPEDARER